MYLIQACEKAWVHFFRHLPGQDQLLQNAQLFVEQLHAACRVWMPLQLVHPVRLPRQWTLLHLLLRGTGFFAYYRLPCGMTCSRKDNQIRNGRSYGEQGPKSFQIMLSSQAFLLFGDQQIALSIQVESASPPVYWCNGRTLFYPLWVKGSSLRVSKNKISGDVINRSTTMAYLCVFLQVKL